MLGLEGLGEQLGEQTGQEILLSARGIAVETAEEVARGDADRVEDRVDVIEAKVEVSAQELIDVVRAPTQPPRDLTLGEAGLSDLRPQSPSEPFRGFFRHHFSDTLTQP